MFAYDCFAVTISAWVLQLDAMKSYEYSSFIFPLQLSLLICNNFHHRDFRMNEFLHNLSPKQKQKLLNTHFSRIATRKQEWKEVFNLIIVFNST